MTGQEIINVVKTHIDQQGPTGSFTDTDLLNLLNEGYTDFCRYAEIGEKQTTAAIAALNSLASLPSDFLDTRQFRWSFNQLLEPKAVRRLDWIQRDWIFQVGVPSNVVFYNWDRVRIKPIPSSAGTVTIRYSYIPAQMTLTSEPFFPVMFHEALIDYVDSQCFYAMREYENATRYWGMYSAQREKAKTQFRIGQRTPDTMEAQRSVNVFNYPAWDAGYRTR